MKRNKLFQQSKKVLRLVFLTTVFICSFFYSHLLFYTMLLKSIVFFPLCFQIAKKSYQKYQKKDLNNEAIALFLSIVLLCLTYVDDAIIILLCSSLIDLFEEEKRKTIIAQTVTILRKNKEEIIPIMKVKKDMVLKLYQGETIPVDGILLSPNLIFTLEDEPTKKFSTKAGDKIISGLKVLSTEVKIKATAPAKESFWVEKELLKEKRIRNIGQETRTYSIYKRIILGVLAIILIFIPNFTTGEVQATWILSGAFFLLLILLNNFERNIQFLKTKITEDGFQRNIDISNIKNLRKLKKVKTIIFEKTETLTLGEFRITGIHSSDEKRMIETLRIVEENSSHPIAEAIKNNYQLKIDAKKIKDFKETPGRGVECKFGKEKILAGNFYFLKDHGIEAEKESSIGTVIYVVRGNNYLGNIVLSDSIKCSIRSLSKNLKDKNKGNITVLSGDNERINKAVCQELEITDQYSNLTPTEKEFWMKHIKERNKGLTMMVANETTSKELLELADFKVLLSKTVKETETYDISIMNNQLEKLPEIFLFEKKYRLGKNIINILHISIIGTTLALMILGTFPSWMLAIDGLVQYIFKKQIERKWGYDDRY